MESALKVDPTTTVTIILLTASSRTIRHAWPFMQTIWMLELGRTAKQQPIGRPTATGATQSLSREQPTYIGISKYDPAPSYSNQSRLCKKPCSGVTTPDPILVFTSVFYTSLSCLLVTGFLSPLLDLTIQHFKLRVVSSLSYCSALEAPLHWFLLPNHTYQS